VKLFIGIIVDFDVPVNKKVKGPAKKLFLNINPNAGAEF